MPDKVADEFYVAMMKQLQTTDEGADLTAEQIICADILPHIKKIYEEFEAEYGIEPMQILSAVLSASILSAQYGAARVTDEKMSHMVLLINYQKMHHKVMQDVIDQRKEDWFPELPEPAEIN